MWEYQKFLIYKVVYLKPLKSSYTLSKWTLKRNILIFQFKKKNLIFPYFEKMLFRQLLKHDLPILEKNPIYNTHSNIFFN